MRTACRPLWLALAASVLSLAWWLYRTPLMSLSFSSMLVCQ